jgi:hypothetical protein
LEFNRHWRLREKVKLSLFMPWRQILGVDVHLHWLWPVHYVNVSDHFYLPYDLFTIGKVLGTRWAEKWMGPQNWSRCFSPRGQPVASAGNRDWKLQELYFIWQLTLLKH